VLLPLELPLLVWVLAFTGSVLAESASINIFRI